MAILTRHTTEEAAGEGAGARPGPPAPHARPARRRRVWWWLLAAVAIVITVAATVVVVRWQGSDPRPVSPQEARERFGRSGSTLAPDPGSLRPAAGVYRYHGLGTESLSLPPKSQHQGPTLPGVVTHRDDGCWTFRIDYSTNHWQDWTYCPRDGSVVEVSGRTYSRWHFGLFASDNTTTFTCDPPALTIRSGAGPGDRWQQSCTGTSTAVSGEAVSSGPYTYVGPEDVDVGGRTVAAHHYRQARTMAGAQVGEQTTELWFAREDGLPLRNERRVRVRTDTPIGVSTYTEEGTFVLSSLEVER